VSEADLILKDHYCVVLWNDDKHSYEEITKLLADLTRISRDDTDELTCQIYRWHRARILSGCLRCPTR
jgi:E3 ubiquitin-protein ligase UBR1